MTLVELMLAISGVALIGLATAGMLSAAASATKSTRDLRSLVVKQAVLKSRIDAELRSSRSLLAADGGSLLLWLDDYNDDGSPNLNEIQILEWNSVAGSFICYAVSFPAGWTSAQLAAANTVITVGSPVSSTFASLKANAYMTSTTWGTSITNFQYTLDAASAATARLVAYRITVKTGDLSDVVIGTAALRTELP